MATEDLHRQICCATYTVGDMEIKAHLYAVTVGLQEQYWICLDQQGERITCECGKDATNVKALFCDIVFGGVTACTVCDVIEDWLGAQAAEATT